MKKIVSTIAAVALTAGIGFAASNASAAPATGLGSSVATQGVVKSGVEQAGFRIRIGFGHRYHYGYHYGRRCHFVGYKYYFHHGYGWVKKPVYRCFYRYY